MDWYGVGKRQSSDVETGLLKGGLFVGIKTSQEMALSLLLSSTQLTE